MLPKNILVCLDSSDYSVAASRFSCYLAKKFNAFVEGFHVIDIMQLESPFMYDLSGALGFEPFANFSEKIKAVLEEKGRNVLSAFESVANQFGVEYKTTMEIGVVSSAILEKQKSFDLVCIGLKGTNEEYDRAILGSNIESVLRKSKKTLLVVPKFFYTPDVAIACVDDRELSIKAYNVAKAYAEGLNIELKAVYVKKKDNIKLPDGVDIVEAISNSEGIETYIKRFDKPIVFLGAYAKPRLLEIFLGSTTEVLLRKNLNKAFVVVR